LSRRPCRSRSELESRIPLYPVAGRKDAMVDRRTSPVQWIASHMPRNQAQLETELKGVLKVVFWGALLAPVILVPVYYLLVALLH